MQLVGATNSYVHMDVPADMATALRAAISNGESAANSWAIAHPASGEAHFDYDARMSVPQPPSVDVTRQELAQLHAIANARTPDGDAAAMYFDNNGGWAMWQNEINSISISDGPVVAQQAWAAMRHAVDRVSAVSDGLKAQFHRVRPFLADPTLTTVGNRPLDGSYPSGHTAAAIAAAMAVADVVPARRDELVDLACQTAWSRVYAGMHHPSDVVAAAALGSRIASDVVRRQRAAGNTPAVA